MNLSMNTVAIIQARMSSSRLPGKVLLPLAGKSVLDHVVSRIKKCRMIHKVVIATSSDISDDVIQDYCERSNIDFYRGHLSDVLDRYYHCANKFNAHNIVRITSDCPAIDPIIVDAVITGFLSAHYDYYGLSGDFPDGLDCEVISMSALRAAWENATLPSDREHVCPYLYSTAKDSFKIGGLEILKNLRSIRLTLDEPRDYKLLKLIFENLYEKNELFLTNDILDLLRKNPSWLNLNSSIIRNQGYEISLQKDKLV